MSTDTDEQLTRLCDQVSAAAPGSEDEKKLSAALTLMVKAASIIKSVPGAGASSTLRWRIYQLIQAQEGDDNAAFYKELKCAIHLGLAGECSDPVTLPCGHSFCKTCVAPMYYISVQPSQRRCPQCREQITVAYSSLKPNVAIKGVTNHLLPLGTTHDPAAIAAIEAQTVGVQQQPLYQLSYGGYWH
jgi:hypothetical protein